MHTKESVEVFMKDFGFKPLTTKSEIKELPNLLSPEEKLLGILEGMLKKVHSRDINGNGIVILTNKRVIFFRKSIIGTVTKEEIPISKISSASFRKGILSSSIAIITSGNEAVVEHCDKTVANRFIDEVQKQISNLDSPPAAALNPSSSNIDQLEKLFEMKLKGILTEEEFLAQKAKLLNA